MSNSSPAPPMFDVLGEEFDDLEEEEIRVLYLEPGSFEEPLTGWLTKASVTPGTFYNPEESEDRDHSWTSCYSRDSSSQKARPSVPYEAVSYAWESMEKPRSINIRNKGDVAITDSLSDLLRHFRYTHDHRKIWVDGVCIDQTDVPERNHQVAKMADIFSASSRVLVWLGVEESTDSLALATMEICMEVDTSDYEDDSEDDVDVIDLKTLRDALCDYTGRHASFKGNLSVPQDAAILAVESIFNISRAKWFERLWVVQETANHDIIIYFRGHRQIHSLGLSRALRLLEEHSVKIQSRNIQIDRDALWNMAQHVMECRMPDSDGGQIMSHFVMYSDRRCHDSRDRVYALRRVLGLDIFDELRPDYRLSYVEVFRRLACICLNARDRSLDTAREITRELEITEKRGDFLRRNPALTLGLVGTELEPRSNAGWPSWVPRLYALTNASRSKQYLYDQEVLEQTQSDPDYEHHWRSYGNLFSSRIVPASPNLLQLRGNCFAEARQSCSLLSVPDLGSNFLYTDVRTRIHVEIIAEWLVALLCFVADCVPGAFSIGLTRSLVNFAFYPTQWLPYEPRDQHRDDFSHSLRLLVTNGTDGKLDLQPKLSHEILDLAFELLNCPLASRRKLWQIQLEGRTDAAWLPAETQIGDEICVFSGAPWPFVIRKVDGSSYTLIGDGHIFHTSLMQALGSERQEFEFWPGEPLGFNTDIHPSDEDMTNLSWITLH